MVLWFIASYFTGIIISFLSSSGVLFLLCKMIYKDHSTNLRIYLTIIDLLCIFILLLAYIPSKNIDFVCFYTSLYYFILVFHGFWVFFIAFSLYLIICRQYEKIKNQTSAFFLAFSILSILSTVVVLMPNNGSHQCVIMLNTKDMTIYLISTAVVFESIVFISISFFYAKIRSTVKSEIKKCDQMGLENHQMCVRLLGYPFLYLIWVLFNDLLLLQEIDNNPLLIMRIRLIMVAFYPFLNAMVYGYTKSSQQFFCNLFLKVPEYNENQDALNELRNEGWISDRIIFDMADISEGIVFRTLDKGTYNEDINDSK